MADYWVCHRTEAVGAENTLNTTLVMAKVMAKVMGVVLLLVQASFQQKNPLNDFCRRFGHQTAVVDKRLYIDGGLVDWNPISQNPQNYSNTWLLYNDLTTSPPTINMPQLYANLSKNSTIPDVSGGVLWADEVNKRFYLYGGDYFNIIPTTQNLLSYDILYDQWEYFGVPNSPVQSVSWAGGVGVSELAKGYTLGGWMSNASMPGWIGGRQATSSLITYDMNANSWTNTSGPDTVPKAEGVMLYIPASNDGLLIYFGGITTPYGNDTIVPLPMSTIYIYDIQSSRWYTQTATGGIPLPRAKFCAGAAWAPDKSSYNIYIYGGYGFGANATGFDDLYILSLPSFTWIPWWESSGGGQPHNSLTCNVVGGKMLIIGGTFPLSTDCDSPLQWGTHNVDLGKVSGSQWQVYWPNNETTYVVPPEVIAVVGGSSLGGATATAPPTGFNTGAGDLAVLFAEKAAVASRTPTRAIPGPTGAPGSGSPALGTGAIAGIAVGGAVALIAITLGCCCFIRRHRSKNKPSELPVPYEATDYAQVALGSPQSPGNRPIHYQLPAPVPVELASNNDDDIRDPKSPVYQQYDVRQGTPPIPYAETASPHSTYSHATTPHSPYPGDLSVMNTPFSRYGTQTSPTPTYSSQGGSRAASRGGSTGGRKPVPLNQTYYSP